MTLAFSLVLFAQKSGEVNVKPAQSAIERAAALVRIRVVEMLVK